MPEGCPVCEARREQNRARQARHRARNATPNVTPASSPRVGAGTRSSVSLVPTYQDSSSDDDVGAIARILARFVDRGYVHSPAYWRRLGRHFPGVDLVLEAMHAAEWLDDPEHPERRKRSCSKRFLSNWVKREASRPAATGTSVATKNGTNGRAKSALARVIEGYAHDQDRIARGDAAPWQWPAVAGVGGGEIGR